MAGAQAREITRTCVHSNRALLAVIAHDLLQTVQIPEHFSICSQPLQALEAILGIREELDFVSVY